MPKVICQICGKEFTTISHHVKVKHNIHIDEYRELYPGQETSDPDWMRIRNEAIKSKCTTQEFRGLMSEISSPYNKSDEARKRNSELMRAQNRDPRFIEARKEAVKAKYSIPEEAVKRSIRLSEQAKSQWARNHDEMARKVGPHKWTSEVTRSTYRSYAEMFLAEQLTYAGINFEYEPRSFKYFSLSHNKIRRYYPDFYISDPEIFIEVKYDEDAVNESVIEKINAVRSSGYIIIIVYHKEIVKSPSVTSYILSEDISTFISRTDGYIRRFNDYRKHN